MRRQLDPHLFGTPIDQSSPEREDSVGLYGTARYDQELKSSRMPVSSNSSEKLALRVEKIRLELDEWLKTANLRIERIGTKATVVEQRLEQGLSDVRQKLALVAGKVKERQMIDAKIESLLERHNQIIQNFETRLAQAMRAIEDQNQTIRSQQHALEENRRYIERLKKL